MRLPRDLSSHELVRSLSKFGYVTTRQTGSHIRLTSHLKGAEHHVTIPAHDALKIGTLSQILNDVAIYLEVSREELIKALFG